MSPSAPKPATGDPYTLDASAVREAPRTFWGALREAGPGLVLAGAVVGAGEIVLTASLGARAGFVLLWWMLFSCWSKSLLQAELARITLVSGEPVMTAFSRLPGKIPFAGRQLPWFPLMWLLTAAVTAFGSAGIFAGVGQVLHAALPVAPVAFWVVAAAVTGTLLALSNSYRLIERALIAMVLGFTVTNLSCFVLLQHSAYAVSWGEVGAGLSGAIPAGLAGLALATFGATGVHSGESMSYTYWCMEKGYARHIGPPTDDAGWLPRARAWVGVMQLDVWLTLVVLTCATVPFYLLGAGVLHRLGIVPDGSNTIVALSGTFTRTLGAWALPIYLFGAFCVLYSTVVSGLAGSARIFADAMAALGAFPRADIAARRRYARGWVLGYPVLGALCYFWLKNPVVMLMIGGAAFAVQLPVVMAATMWLRHKHLDPRLRSGRLAGTMLWVLLVVFALLAAATVHVQLGGRL